MGHTEEGRRRIAESKMGERNPAKRLDVRKKLSIAGKIRWAKKSKREILAQARSGGKAFARHMKNDPEFRKRVSRKHSGNRNAAKKPASRKAISEGQKRAWRDPKIRARRTKALQKAWDRDYEWRSVVSDETCKKLSKAMKGKNPGSWSRRPGTHWYVGKQGRIAMRSPDEVEYAKTLDTAGIQWLYECCTFAVGKRWWTPDFYLPVQRKFVEVKGWLVTKIKRKILKAMKHYASTSFELKMVA